jgi:hypothetical protein
MHILPPDGISLTGFIAGPVAEKANADAEFLGEDPLCRPGVHAGAQNLGAGFLEVLEDIVEAPQLPASAVGEGQQVEGQDNVPLAFEVGQGDLIALSVPERKIGGLVADLEGHALSSSSGPTVRPG